MKTKLFDNLFVYRALGCEKAGMRVDRSNEDQEPSIQIGEGLAQYCLIFRDLFFYSISVTDCVRKLYISEENVN